MKRTVLASAFLAVFAIPSLALATDGYFAHGYGMKAKGMGGASTAMAIDSFGGANNPASMVWAGSRFDIGVDLFSPKRDIARSGSSGFGTGMDGAVNSGSNLFAIPEFGYNRMIGWDMSVGVSVYGNGGMNTDYDGGQIAGGNVNACGSQAGGFNQASGQAGPYNLLCGSGKLGMNLEQLIIAPTFAKKVNKDHSLGVSLLVARQTFKAEGLSAFYSYTTPGGVLGTPYASGNNLTERGNDSTWGYGLKLGWMGKVSDTVTLGASYTSRVKMAKFDKYKDLFAGEGYFDRLFGHQVGRQSEHEWRLDDRRHFGLRQLPRLWLGQRECVQAGCRISVQPEPDPARRVQSHRQPDPGPRRDLQHDRAGRGPGSSDLGIHL